jgi:hypothetical protein
MHGMFLGVWPGDIWGHDLTCCTLVPPCCCVVQVAHLSPGRWSSLCPHHSGLFFLYFRSHFVLLSVWWHCGRKRRSGLCSWRWEETVFSAIPHCFPGKGTVLSGFIPVSLSCTLFPFVASHFYPDFLLEVQGSSESHSPGNNRHFTSDFFFLFVAPKTFLCSWKTRTKGRKCSRILTCSCSNQDPACNELCFF